LKLQKTPVFLRVRSDYESAPPPLSYLGPSVNPLPLAQHPQADEPDIPLHLRLNGLSRETYFPANAGLCRTENLPRQIAPTVLAQFGATHRDKKDNLTTFDNN
jgi:hypothetical protein